MLAFALALSLAGLAVGPALVALGRGRAMPSAAIEGLTLGVVPVLVGVRLAPHLFEELGWWSVALIAAGYAGLWLADRWGHVRGARVGSAVIVPALAAHALTDGAALAVAAASARAGAQEGTLLAAAIVLHRLPEGLFVAATLVPELGWRRAMSRLGLVAAATVVGAVAGRWLLARVPDALIDGVVAFGLGAMLRLVVHSHAPAARGKGARAAAGAAFAAGIALALAVPAPDSVLRRAQPRELSFVQSLGPLFVETAPALLAGLLAAALLRAFLPAHGAAWLRGGSSLGQAVRGAVFGLNARGDGARGLLVAGAPAAAVVACAVATPELVVNSALISARLLGVPFTAARVAASLAAAVGVALLVAAVVRRSAGGADPLVARGASAHAGEDDGGGPGARRGVAARLRGAVADACVASVDHVAAWYVAGLLAAAAFEAAVQPALVARLGAPADVVASAVVAAPLYVCAAGATLVAAVMIHKGFSVGAALAFLTVSAGTHVAVLAAVRRALGVRAAAAFALGSVACAIAAGLAANALVARRTVPEIHPLVAHDHVRVEWACAAVLAALLLASLLRLGPRGWFARLSGAPPHADDAGDSHAHAH